MEVFMEKEFYYNLVNKYFKNKVVRKKFYEQIDMFFNVLPIEHKKYNVGDYVELGKNYLMHGTKIKPEELIKIKNNGLLGVEFYDKEYSNQKKPYTCEFWHIKEKTLLGDYIKKYTGGTIFYETREGMIENVVAFDQIENEIKTTNLDYFQWQVYQTKEGRFLPTNKKVTMSFIINGTNNTKLLNNSIQSDDLDENIKKKILPKWFYDKYVKGGFHNYDSYETRRESAILFGIPSSLIEGICVNSFIEKDTNTLKQIKEIFPNCYICNVEGKVIVE